MTDDRTTDIESRLMHQEKLLQELNTVVFRQQNEIECLSKTVGDLRRHMKEMRDSGSAGEIIDTPPPHY